MHIHAMCLKLRTGYREWPHNGNAMHGCASLDTYSRDMPMKCMLMP